MSLACRVLSVLLPLLAGCALVTRPAYDRGNAWMQGGYPDRAIAKYTEAVRQDPRNAKAFNARGLAWTAKGALDQAVADFDQAIHLDPGLADAYVNRGVALVSKGEVDRAIADYTQAIRIDPKLSYAFNDRGVAWRQKGNLQRAIADYDEAIRIDPKDVRALANRGRAHFYDSQFIKAQTDFARAHELEPQSAAHLIWLYLALARAGDEGEARATLVRGVKDLKDFDWPAAVIGLFTGKVDSDALSELVASSGPSIQPYRMCETRFYIGQWYLLKARSREAQSLLSRAVHECPRDADAYDGAVFELTRMNTRLSSLAPEGR